MRLQNGSNTPIKERVQVFFRYRSLLERDLDELTKLVSEENGKTYDEAKAEVEKSIELTEFACSMPQLVSGEILEVSKGVECRTEHFPLGVVASIVPFNFPLMVPNWTMPNALVLGNTMVMKPSELVPLSVVKMAELLKEAGLPDGVFNVINGGKEIVEGIVRSQRHRSRQFCRFDQSCETRLPAINAQSETLYRARRREKSSVRFARRESADDGDECYRFDVGLRRTTMYGGFGDARGRRC